MPCSPLSWAQFSKPSLLLYPHRQSARISCLHSHVGRRGNLWWHLTNCPIFPLNVTWLACHACYEMPVHAHILYQWEPVNLKLRRLAIPKSFAHVLQRTKRILLHKSLTETLTESLHWHSLSARFPRIKAVRQNWKEERQELLYLLFIRSHA